jgi:hypothetical protein
VGQHGETEAALGAPGAGAASRDDRAAAERWHYGAGATLREARAQYFARAGFSEATYRERWVVLRVAGVRALAFPNSQARVRAVKLHDLHHVLTGYPTTWAGEGEIGAWELASGCRDHWAAWGLNFSAALIGLFVAPRRVARAFARGRRERNLYAEELRDALLEETVGAARARLGIDAG